MPLLVISNPACGAGTGHQFVEEHVLPYLTQRGKTVDKVVITEGENHAGHVLLEYTKKTQQEAIDVILSSGDGTLHEIINVLAQAPSPSINRIHFALVPTGTANALYSTLYPPSATDDTNSASYRLKGVEALVKGNSKPITIAVSSFLDKTGTQLKQVLSAVVVSAALHASILHDSEALRKDIPDLRRFKVAAEKNIARWYDASARFLPGPSGKVQIYDPSKKAFVDHVESTKASPSISMEGPFEYFLSTVNTDRLEPQFRIMPLRTRIPPESVGWMDVVVVRPLRDDSIKGKGEDQRTAFIAKAVAVLQGAYADGSQVDMRYSSNGEVAIEGDGKPVVEYIRCGGWEWIPNSSDEHDSLICCDGAIHKIENEGRSLCIASTASNNVDLYVCV